MSFTRAIVATVAAAVLGGFAPAALAIEYTDDWQAVDPEVFHDATDWNDASYLRSDTGLIEDFRLGDDGFMYVAVVDNATLVGYFRYPYEYTPPPGGDPDPFGDGLSGDPGTFVPPGGDGWSDTPPDYGSIPEAPEPAEWMLMAAGLGAMAWVIRRRR
jgi:hypothetical protein